MRNHRLNIIFCVAILALFTMFFAYPLAAEHITAEQVTDKCADALGGKAKIKALKTMRFKVTYPGHDDLITTEIMRPNLIQNSSPSYCLTFDGKQAGYLKMSPKQKGSRLIPKEELKDFELEIALFFPAFFDHKVEYKGMAEVDGINTHKLYVKLPLGAEVTYYINSKSFLPHQVEARVKVKDKTYLPTRVYQDFKTVDGILYPHSFLYWWRSKEESKKAKLHSVEFNPKINKSHFLLPADIQ